MIKGKITFRNKNEKLEKTSILKLTFKEDILIKKTIERFNDEDPCIIHRTYANNILGKEILDKMNNCGLKSGIYKKEELENNFFKDVIFPEGTEDIELN